MLFGVLLLANIGFPLTLNFFGELQILFGFLGTKTPILLFIFLVMINNIAYSLKLAGIMWGSAPAWYNKAEWASSHTPSPSNNQPIVRGSALSLMAGTVNPFVGRLLHRFN